MRAACSKKGENCNDHYFWLGKRGETGSHCCRQLLLPVPKEADLESMAGDGVGLFLRRENHSLSLEEFRRVQRLQRHNPLERISLQAACRGRVLKRICYLS